MDVQAIKKPRKTVKLGSVKDFAQIGLQALE